jgi:replicative DNA helicase
MIKNLGKVLEQVKPFLEKYLEEHGHQVRGRLFKCPNHKEHSNDDAKPSCNFLDNSKTGFYCYACSCKGDIFDALHLIENKETTGENFYEAVKYLANKYNVPVEEVNTDEEKFLESISTYLTGVVFAANQTLIQELNTNQKLKDLLVKKQWIKSIDKFKLGYLKSTYISTVSNDILSYLNLNPKDLVGRLLIPIYNQRGLIIGLTTRTIELEKKDDTGSGYKHYLAYSLKNVMFNLHNVDPTQEVIVVEGASSILTMYSHGITNAVATFGNIMSDNQYSILVRKKVSKMLFMYDGDAGGLEGLRNSLKVMSKTDIATRVAFLKDDLDPGDYVMTNLNFDKVDKVDLYDYLLTTYGSNTNDKHIEQCLMRYIISINDIVRKEKTVDQTSKQLKLNKSTITDLLSIYESNANVSTAAVLKERECLVEVLNDFEKWSWARGQMLGLRSFKSFDVKLDGIQNGFILIGGKAGSGKSALMLSMVVKMLKNNNNVYMLYFTIDDSMFVTVSRFIANLSDLPINVVSSPNFKITKADLPEQVKRDYINRRENALNFLRTNATFLNLKDGEDGATIEMIQEKVKAVQPLAQGKQLVVVIDNLHNLRSRKYTSSEKHLVSNISNELNAMSNIYKCPVIASTHITKAAIQNKVYDGTALKDTVDLDFDNKLFMMMTSDSSIEEEDDLEGTKEDIQVRVVVAKNKFSAFKGKIPMIFYRSLSKVEDLDSTDPATVQKDEGNLFK